MTNRRFLRRTCLILALAGAVGATLLAITGGFDLALGGSTLTAHEPRRPLIVSILALAGYFALGGRISRHIVTAIRQSPRYLATSPQLVAVALALGVFVAAFSLGAKTAGGSDSYGYVSQAHLWLRGQLKQPMPWTAQLPWPSPAATFQPLGYSRQPMDTTLVPVYSPGLPMAMAVFMAVGGACAAFLVVPVTSAVSVFATFRLGRFVSSDWVGVMAAWLLATSPTFLQSSMQPMSDVPVTAAWLLTFALATRVSSGAALMAGLATSWAVLIRINLAPLAVMPLAWFVVQAWRSRTQGWRVWQPPLLFAGAASVGMIVAGALNWSLNGSPFLSGYGSASYLFSFDNVAQNIRLYPAWFTESQTPLIWLGVIALCLPLRHVWPQREGRLMVWCLLGFTLALWIQYLAYGVFDAWWYLRFLLPSIPFVLIGFTHACMAVSRRNHRLHTAVGVIVVALGVNGVVFAQNKNAFYMRGGNSQFFTAARVVRAVTDPSAVVLSMQHSGSLRHYAGRMTMRYDLLESEWLDASVAWFAERGIHAYALLDAFEVPAWRTRFAGQRLGPLDFNPIREFEGSSGMALYDLLSPGPAEPRKVSIAPGDLDCQPPASPPAFPLMAAQE